eukprot:3936759-Rhodomonas_salina.2
MPTKHSKKSNSKTKQVYRTVWRRGLLGRVCIRTLRTPRAHGVRYYDSVWRYTACSTELASGGTRCAVLRMRMAIVLS